MEKLKQFLKLVKRYHFWGLLALVVIIAPVVWYLATSRLVEEFQKKKSDILSMKSKAEEVQRKQLHPNPVFHKNQDELIALRRQSVIEAWTKNYMRQSGILVWPKSLGPEFLEAAAKLRNVEEVMQDKPTWQGIQLRNHLRDRYRNFIHLELPKLAELVGATWAPSGARGQGAGGQVAGEFAGARPGEATRLDKPALVLWEPGDQANIVSGHFDWAREAEQRPSTLQVVYAQEDLWVLTAILNAIAKTNGEIEFPYQAKIKEIKSIKMGKEASVLEGQVRMPVGAEPAAAAPAGVAGMVPPPGMMEGGRPAPGMQGALGGSGEASNQPADMRYVDKLYKPLPADTLMNLGKTTDPGEAYLAVAKRMPVRIRLVMDTRRVNDFLIECANSALTIEVRQVRINPEAAGKDGGNRNAGGGGEFGRPSGEGPRASDPLSNSYVGDVEVYGIVYIFNAPNNERVGVAVPEVAASPAPATTETPAAPGPAAAPGTPAATAPSAPPAGAAEPGAAEKTDPKGAAEKAPPAAPAPAAKGEAAAIHSASPESSRERALFRQYAVMAGHGFRGSKLQQQPV